MDLITHASRKSKMAVTRYGSSAYRIGILFVLLLWCCSGVYSKKKLPKLEISTEVGN